MSRLEIAESLEAFHCELETLLRTYRSQRAWKVMVWLRKAYSLLFRKGWLAFLRFLIATPFNGGAPLEDYEPEFPSLRSYLPREVWRPYTSESLTSEVVSQVRIRRLRSAVPPAARYDMILLPVVHFDYRYQRPQQIAAHLARAGHRVFWICPKHFLPVDSSRAFQLSEREPGLWEVRVRGLRFDYHAEVAGPRHVEIMVEALERLYAECGIAESCVVIQWAALHPVATAIRARFGSPILYDCMDDWDTFPDAGRPNIIEERRLVESCDALVVTSGALRQKFSRQGKPSAIIRNGADFEFFQHGGGTDPLPELAGPVVGYYGAIAAWTDLDLIRAAARLRPQYSFVLVGENEGQDLSGLDALPNVKILGQRPYSEMPAFLRRFDVCLIPFRLNEITHATDPVKLYEYFSQGRPVVATAMKELEVFGDLLRLAGGEDEFVRMIDESVAETDQDIRRRRIEFARANTWKARVEALKKEIDKTFPLVSILLVTHNSREFIQPCLEALARNTLWPSYEIVAVDNASNDGTPEILDSYARKDFRVRFFPQPSNLGFAGGNNFAARQARGECLILLNADTLVTAGWVERLVRPARRDPGTGIVVAVTNMAGNEAKINASYHDQAEMEAFAAALAREKFGQQMEVRVAPLFCALIPRPVWRELGELDERFSVGMFEDDDYSMRARRAGYRIVTAEDCFVHHFGQGSFQQLGAKEAERIFEANRARFEKKWGEPWQPHRYRPGILPERRERRFSPAAFCRPLPPQ